MRASLSPRPTTTCLWLKADASTYHLPRRKKSIMPVHPPSRCFLRWRKFTKGTIAVLLTGGDGDGSFGGQIIKEQGGKVIAQDRPTSENFSMPESSIKTGDVD